MTQFWSKNAVKDVVRRHWDRRAATFDEGLTHAPHSPEQEAAWNALMSRWGGDSSLDTLDVGCGTGFLALSLAALGHRSVGADFAESMIERAREKATSAGLTVRFDVADAENIADDDASFDLVIERHVVWTLPDPVGALIEWRRVLRPGGRLILIEGHWSSGSQNSPSQEDYEPIRESLPLEGGAHSDELTRIAESANFPDITIEPLMDPALWGNTPERDRYALHARKPA